MATQALYKFPTRPDYEAAKPSLPIPYVALIEDTGEVIYANGDTPTPESNYYTKDECDARYEGKGVAYPKTETYNKSEVDALVGDIDSALSNI